MNINERMAEVMGWKRLMWWLTLDEEMPCWISTNEDEVMRAEMSVRDWHPDTDLNQALMCVDKFTENDELYSENLSIIKNTCGDAVRYEIVIRDTEMKRVDSRDKLPRAICECILEVIDG